MYHPTKILSRKPSLMARPTIHITPEAKLTAACEKCRCYYANHRELCSPKHDMKESQNLLKAISKVLHGSASDEDSESESDNENSESKSDTDINLFNLMQCLFALKIIKDKMLMVTDDPCTFVQGVFAEYIKTLDDSIKGDVTILKKAMAIIEGLLNHVISIQDQILCFCGITYDKWQATDLASCFLRTILAYLENILGLLTFDGAGNLAVAHSMGELILCYGSRIMSSGSDAVVLQNLISIISVKNPCYNKKQTNHMAGTEWVTAEQKAYLQGSYNDFLKAQAQGTVLAFWPGVYLTWF
ncbi:uncharacterized protein F5147DRAFT_652423 [Suillus discolor]|uniref:Uncharacterized protein n=1 Tax=Suillus discolor TaxID=1912936 RepID=A0A9P7F8I2_9AGAM|nr:uncharacterized protein F5147DRAFT_652423 [Suillus discolor]KAG2109334.1 hypothetical protein F5147DRAFT_652423 [Suillus discolor]